MRIRYPRITIGFALLFGLVLTCAHFGIGVAKSHGVPQSEQQFQQLIRSLEGPDLFRAYCASCHGADAKGNGPAASALKTEVPDLTILTKKNEGPFPAARVRRMILGDEVVASHGSREMPVWGPIFHQIEADVDRGNVRLENLVKYIESIQSIAPSASQEKRLRSAAFTTSTSPSGAELYKQHCAACHGNDLKGVGPAPPPFREYSPDLTTLAQRNGGEFPDAYVFNVLRNGADLPDHGPAEMPVWGTAFKQSERLDDTQITLRMTELVNYIQSFQTK